MDPKPKIVLLGASHIVKLSKYFTPTDYEVIILGFSGKRLVDIMSKVPEDMLKNLTSKDTIICQPFTNNVFAIGTHKITRNPKVIHLEKWQVLRDEEIKTLCQLFEKFLNNTDARILFLENFYKHLFCCKDHNFPKIISYQSRFRKIVKKYFTGSEHLNYTDLIFQGRKKNNRKAAIYSLLASDTVHLRENFYEELAQKIMEKYFS